MKESDAKNREKRRVLHKECESKDTPQTGANIRSSHLPVVLIVWAICRWINPKVKPLIEDPGKRDPGVLESRDDGIVQIHIPGSPPIWRESRKGAYVYATAVMVGGKLQRVEFDTMRAALAQAERAASKGGDQR